MTQSGRHRINKSGPSLSFKTSSLLAALFLSPLSAIPCIVGFLVVTHFASSDPFFSAQMIPAYLWAGIPVAYIFTLILGAPIHLLLEKGQIKSVSLRIVLGAIAAAVVGLFVFDAQQDFNQILFAALLAICGATIAAVFSKIAKYD